MDISDRKKEKWYALSLHWQIGERSFDRSGSFNSRQNFQDTNDKKVENKHILKPCRQDDVLLRLQSWLKCKPNSCIKEGGIRIFSFGLFLDRFFGFCAKKLRFLGFGVHFPFFSIWFSVFAKNINGFSDLISDAVFGFSSLTNLGSGFSSIWAAIMRLHWSRIAP